MASDAYEVEELPKQKDHQRTIQKSLLSLEKQDKLLVDKRVIKEVPFDREEAEKKLLAGEQKKEAQENLLREHLKNLFNKRVKDFRELLEESSAFITPLSHWPDVKDHLQEDARYTLFPERNRQHTFQQHVEFLGKKVKREFILFLGDMGTQMNVQRVKSKHGGNEREAMRELEAMFDERDPRFERMGRYYRDERELIMRQELSKK